MRRGEVLLVIGENTETNNLQPTQSEEIEDFGERSTVVTQGTAKLLDTSVGVEVTRQHDASRLSFTGIAHDASAEPTATLQPIRLK